MSADLHIHVCTPAELPNVRAYLSADTSWSAAGEKEWHRGYELMCAKDGRKFRVGVDEIPEGIEFDHIENVEIPCDEQAATESPNIWVGEVSWLKAALFGDSDTYIPATVEKVQELLSEQPLIDETLIAQVEQAFTLPNQTKKEGGVWSGKGYSIAHVEDVVSFLRLNAGKHAYTISW